MEVLSDDRVLRWIFVTPSGIYQRAQSELIVNSDHGAQYNPDAVREVERILKLNLAGSR